MINSSAGTDDAGVAIAAARAGADVVRAMYGQRLTRVDKGGGDFATAADLAAEQAILDVIRARRSDDAVLTPARGAREQAGSAAGGCTRRGLSAYLEPQV
ncbi:inositol monophosphatase family protein [Micromonospora pisi]|uniref:inositol monophosphatase family protein n=1 Tax=Micromonospora pisi TaxID=589240 RepID=UPI000EACC56F|nr:inositol monophosphatase family protein [Micromonospora pisi]